MTSKTQIAAYNESSTWAIPVNESQLSDYALLRSIRIGPRNSNWGMTRVCLLWGAFRRRRAGVEICVGANAFCSFGFTAALASLMQ